MAAFDERHFRARELAKLWGFGYTTILEMFKNEPGVLRKPSNRPEKRGYSTISIPASVALRVHSRLSQELTPERPPVRIKLFADAARQPPNIIKLHPRRPKANDD